MEPCQMTWRFFMAPWPLEMEPGKLLCFPTGANTPPGVVTPGPACSEHLLSGSGHSKSLTNTKSSCQTSVFRLASQAEFHRQQQPSYPLHHTGLPLNCSAMESFFHHHLHHCLHPMRIAIKIKPWEIKPSLKEESCLVNKQWVISNIPSTYLFH